MNVCRIIASFVLIFAHFLLILDVVLVRRLEEENDALKRSLEEKDKETAARDQYDKALADRLSIVAESLAGDGIILACEAFCFDISDPVCDIGNHPQVFLA